MHPGPGHSPDSPNLCPCPCPDSPSPVMWSSRPGLGLEAPRGKIFMALGLVPMASLDLEGPDLGLEAPRGKIFMALGLVCRNDIINKVKNTSAKFQ